MTKYTAIVLSAGSGTRMNADRPKQYLPILGKPVIYYALKAFEDSPVNDIVLVCGENDVEYCERQIVKLYGFKKVKAIVAGGSERYHSVYEGLKAAEGADYVMIHDGARPILPDEIIKRAMNMVRLEKACVVGMPVKDTIRIIDANRHAIDTPDRAMVWQVQTPQCFPYLYIMEAYEKLEKAILNKESLPNITDDAMVAEYFMGAEVKMIEGTYRNLKITTPEDLKLAEELLR